MKYKITGDCGIECKKAFVSFIPPESAVKQCKKIIK